MADKFPTAEQPKREVVDYDARMTLTLTDTITAQASAAGPAQRGIIRLSGDDVVAIVQQVFRPNRQDGKWHSPKSSRRFEGHIELPTLGTPLEAALMLWPARRSYTGQPMAELHTIGAPPILDLVIEQLLECGARHANRGEFTMRAFLAGRMDLVQAEAVLGVIDAADHKELESALTQLGGGITTELTFVRSQILTLLGDLEAGLDFVEEDIEFISNQQICDRLGQCHDVLHKLLGSSDKRLSSGYQQRVVLAGRPNAGKSTLFNRLLGTEKAIVSPIAGTTRDYLSGHVTFGQTEAEIIDTAGWEEAADLIMRRAQESRSDQLTSSDLIIWCTAADLSADEAKEERQLYDQLPSSVSTCIQVATRIDLVAAADRSRMIDSDTLMLNGHSGEGIDEVIQKIESALNADNRSKSELVSSTAVRCRDSLRRSITAILSAKQAAADRLGDEIIAMELRDALHQIATILGEVYTDDILDHIFSNFCIGK